MEVSNYEHFQEGVSIRHTKTGPPLFAILLIMATFVLTGLFIWKAPEAAQLDLRQSLGGEFDIFADWSSSPYAVKEPVKDEADEETVKMSSSFLMYSTVQFTPENIAAIKRGVGSSPYFRFAGCTSKSITRRLVHPFTIFNHFRVSILFSHYNYTTYFFDFIFSLFLT